MEDKLTAGMGFKNKKMPRVVKLYALVKKKKKGGIPLFR